MSDMQRDDNIVNIDGSKRYKGNRVRKPKKKALSFIKPEHIGALIFLLIFAYLVINLYIYLTREQTSIYEVTSVELAQDTVYRGIVVRSEELVEAGHTGHINYYVGDNRRAARNGVVFTIDSGSEIYSELRAGFEEFSLTDEEIYGVKAMITRYMSSYDSFNIAWISEFQSELGETVSDYVNDNMIVSMEELRNSGVSRSSFYVCKTGVSGVVSYNYDSLNGITYPEITGEMFAKDYPYSVSRIKNGSLVDASEYAYRICDDETWSIVCKVDQDFYVSRLESDKATVFIGDSITPLPCSLKTRQSGSDYLACLTFDSYMSQYMNDRFLNVRFASEEQAGLKIPVSSIVSKAYYLVPVNCFAREDGYGGYVLRVLMYGDDGEALGYRCVYPSRYFSDGYYAYIDSGLLKEGDIVLDPETGSQIRVSTVNYLEGVYCVNKGYYQFVRIDKLRQNSEFAIISPDTVYGIRCFDHIALEADKAVEGDLIYKIER